MGKVLVPALYEQEFRADGRFTGVESETLEDFDAAMLRLAAGSVERVYLGKGCEPLDREAFASATRAYASLAGPVMVLTCDGRCIWSNEAATDESFCAERFEDGQLATAFAGFWRRSYERAFRRVVDTRRLVRTIISRDDVQYEMTLMPAGDARYGLVAAVLGERNLASSLAGRVERLAAAAPSLFPPDAEKMVSLRHEERVAP